MVIQLLTFVIMGASIAVERDTLTVVELHQDLIVGHKLHLFNVRYHLRRYKDDVTSSWRRFTHEAELFVVPLPGRNHSISLRDVQ